MERKSSLATGLAALSQRKLILLLTLVTAGLGLLGAMPLVPAFQNSLAGTLAGDHLIRNHPTFAPTDVIDFLREHRDAVSGARRTALALGVLGVCIQTFLCGGMVAALNRGPFSFTQLFEPARRNFWHNLKCLFLFAILAGVVLGIWFGSEAAIAKKAFENVPPDATIRSAVQWVSIVVAVLLFGALSLSYDFARAARRYAPTIGAWRAYRFAWRSLSGSWLRAIALFLFWLIAGGGVLLATVGAAWGMPAVSWPAILALFLVQFAALWVRSAVRVGAWASYIGFLSPRARAVLSSLS